MPYHYGHTCNGCLGVLTYSSSLSPPLRRFKRIREIYRGTIYSNRDCKTRSQGYPAKPVRVLSTFTAGAVADSAIRMVAQKMASSMGQSIVVEVQTGAGGLLAAQPLVRSAPDGDTILHAAPSTVVSSHFLQKNPPYHPMKDFTYITRLAIATSAILVTASLPANTVKELIDYARANPGKPSYASHGVGATQHLEMDLLKTNHDGRRDSRSRRYSGTGGDATAC